MMIDAVEGGSVKEEKIKDAGGETVLQKANLERTITIHSPIKNEVATKKTITVVLMMIMMDTKTVDQIVKEAQEINQKEIEKDHQLKREHQTQLV